MRYSLQQLSFLSKTFYSQIRDEERELIQGLAERSAEIEKKAREIKELVQFQEIF